MSLPLALQRRLGEDGGDALVEVLASEKDEVVTLVFERFDERLAIECGKLRDEMRSSNKELRIEMQADFRVQLADVRSDLLKWSFVFWVGQVVAVLGIVALVR